MAAIILQDASGPFLYGTLNRRPQMTLPRPRSDRLGSEGSSIMNGHHHHHHLMGEAHLTTSISAYNTQDVWTPIQTHRYVVRIIPLQLRLVKFLWIFFIVQGTRKSCNLQMLGFGDNRMERHQVFSFIYLSSKKYCFLVICKKVDYILSFYFILCYLFKISMQFCKNKCQTEILKPFYITKETRFCGREIDMRKNLMPPIDCLQIPASTNYNNFFSFLVMIKKNHRKLTSLG